MPKQKQRITLKNTVPGWILPPDGLKLEVKAQRSWILLVFNICTFSWNVRSCVSQVGFSQSTKPSQQLHTCAVGKEAVSQGPSYCAPNFFFSLRCIFNGMHNPFNDSHLRIFQRYATHQWDAMGCTISSHLKVFQSYATDLVLPLWSGLWDTEHRYTIYIHLYI